MKFFTFLLLVTSWTFCLQAQQRTFTSTDGKTITAEIVSATPDYVTLKMADGTTPVVPVTRLSDEDKFYIKTWSQANPTEIRYNFIVDWSDECLSDKKRGEARRGLIESTEKWICHLKVTNRSNQALDNLEVKYQIQYVKMNGKSKSIETRNGTNTIPLIKSNETIETDTSVVELEFKQVAAGYSYKDPKMPRKEEDDIKGVVISLWHQGKQVHEFLSRGIKKIEVQ